MLLFYIIVQFDENDKLPKYFCKNCIENLQQAHQFKAKCELTHNKLMQLFEITYYEKVDLLPIDIKIEENQSNVMLYKSNENIDYNDLKNLLTSDVTMKKYKKIKSFECYMCSSTITFKTKLAIQRHMRKEHKFDIYDNLKKSCNLCSKTYTDASSLFRHNKRVHLGIKMKHKRTDTPCEFCGNCFATFGSKERHVRIVHKGEKSFKCNLCGSAFGQISGLYAHQSQVHNTEKKFQCNICPNKSYMTKDGLLRHQTFHLSGTETPNRTGSYQYNRKRKQGQKEKRQNPTNYNTKRIICEICGKSINVSGVLAHRLMHQGIKPHKCTVCSRSFRTKQDLKLHNVMHTNIRQYICDICDKSFRRRPNLVQHLKLHSGEKPFKCSYCSKQFFVRFNLKLHERVHTNEKPFSCNMCSSKFSNSSTLRKHAIGVHKQQIINISSV